MEKTIAHCALSITESVTELRRAASIADLLSGINLNDICEDTVMEAAMLMLLILKPQIKLISDCAENILAEYRKAEGIQLQYDRKPTVFSTAIQQ